MRKGTRNEWCSFKLFRHERSIDKKAEWERMPNMPSKWIRMSTYLSKSSFPCVSCAFSLLPPVFFAQWRIFLIAITDQTSASKGLTIDLLIVDDWRQKPWHEFHLSQDIPQWLSEWEDSKALPGGRFRLDYFFFLLIYTKERRYAHVKKRKLHDVIRQA